MGQINDRQNVLVNLLEKQKVLLHPLRMRHELDNFEYLLHRKEVPLHIYGRNDFAPIDAILHTEQVKGLRHLKHFDLRPVYFKNESEEIRCMIDKILVTPDQQHYFKVYLRRYIVGEPNIVSVQFSLPVRFHDGFKKKQISWRNQEIKMLCYNETYPLEIELDYKRLARNGKITFGDLQNILPRGLELLPKHKKNLNYEIVTLSDLMSKLEADLEHQRRILEVDEDTIQVLSVDTENIDSYGDENLLAVERELRRQTYGEKAVKEKSTVKRPSHKQAMKEDQMRMKAELEKKLASEQVLMGPSASKKK